ncbi:MAG: hypothetical protein QXP38_04780 [Nitrososphaerota archaeon]
MQKASFKNNQKIWLLKLSEEKVWKTVGEYLKRRDSAKSDEEQIQIMSELRAYLNGVMGATVSENLKLWCAIFISSLKNEESLFRTCRILETLVKRIESLEKRVKNLEDEIGFRKEHK